MFLTNFQPGPPRPLRADIENDAERRAPPSDNENEDEDESLRQLYALAADPPLTGTYNLCTNSSRFVE
jgi:hypothetical protein